MCLTVRNLGKGIIKPTKYDNKSALNQSYQELRTRLLPSFSRSAEYLVIGKTGDYLNLDICRSVRLIALEKDKTKLRHYRLIPTLQQGGVVSCIYLDVPLSMGLEDIKEFGDDYPSSRLFFVL